MKAIVENSNDIDLDSTYRDIKKLIEVVKMQKDTNELLIRQQMGFNAQILNIINPRREIKTYNSYGNLSK
jgi:flagellar biosynthesis/type III secretory pathway chaperone